MAGWPSTPSEQLIRLARGFWVSQALYVAAELGLADLLADGPRTADDLASTAGAHAPALYRVLRLLASEGVFAETEDGRFELTPMAAAHLRGIVFDQPAARRSAGTSSRPCRTEATPTCWSSSCTTGTTSGAWQSCAP